MTSIDVNLVVCIGVDPPVLLLNDKVAHTHFNSDTKQLFETEEGSFIYYKDEEKIFKISIDSYTRLLLKLQRLETEIKEKEHGNNC